MKFGHGGKIMGWPGDDLVSLVDETIVPGNAATLFSFIASNSEIVQPRIRRLAMVSIVQRFPFEVLHLVKRLSEEEIMELRDFARACVEATGSREDEYQTKELKS